MTILGIDIETYSSVDLVKSGVYRYAESSDFEILLFAYAYDDDPVQIIDLAQGEKLPMELLSDLTSSKVIKTAYNANFERVCISRYTGVFNPPEQWQCTQAYALTLGLPTNLDTVAESLKLKHQKLDKGKQLIRLFSIPKRTKKAHQGQESIFDLERNTPAEYPERWEEFKRYCIMDVEVERELRNRLHKYPMSGKEQKIWQLDQKMNDLGVRVDRELVRNAIECSQLYYNKLFQEAQELTGVANPNSAEQIKHWIKSNHDIHIDSLSRERVTELVKEVRDPQLKRVLELRLEMSKTSVKKYEAMQRTVCKNGRIKGILQYYGASRSGRWAGRLVQIHNLPRNHLKDLGTARDLVKTGDYEMLEMLFDSVPDVLSQLIRTAFIPSDGCRFIVCDFSAIEARVIAWLAGERWRLDVFAGDGKIYEASAAEMFKVPVESIGKGSELRQRGKVAELACGYQGGKGALISMGALNMGLTEDELTTIVQAWRKANPKIVQLWYDMERAALRAVQDRTKVEMQFGVEFSYENGMMFIRLPSGRRMAYARPRIEMDERFGKDQLTYEGINTARQWDRLGTFGGKLVENCIQAIARDCLAESLIQLDEAGYRIAFHVHDEAVLDMPHSQGSLEEVEEIMSQDIPWAPDLPMKAAGFETTFYMKD